MRTTRRIGPIRGGASETRHLRQKRYRAWPPVDCGDACGARPDLAADAGLNAAFVDSMTPLAHKHWRFLRSLDRAYFASGRARDDGSAADADRDATTHFVDPD